MDINEKFRKYYAEQGISEEAVADFDLDSLDYVHWGNNSVAFPHFFEVEEISEVTGYVYTGNHGPEGIRVTAATLEVGQLDPRNPNYRVDRLLKSIDLNGVEIVLIGLSVGARESDNIEAKVAPYVHCFQSLEPMANLLAASFGPVPVHVVDWNDHTQNVIWTIHQ